MRKIYISLLICCFSLALLACSDDSSEPSTPDSGTTDVSADSSTDIQEDTTFDAEEEVEEEDPKIVAGETCPSNCRSLDGGAGYAVCNECEHGYCNFPSDNAIDSYCTKTCNSDSNCRSLGEGWTCGDDFSVCVFEK